MNEVIADLSLQKPVESLEDSPLPKRRKLSQRQIEILRRSLIEPVKEQKWENFFSLNYQSETGEGKGYQIALFFISDVECVPVILRWVVIRYIRSY